MEQGERWFTLERASGLSIPPAQTLVPGTLVCWWHGCPSSSNTAWLVRELVPVQLCLSLWASVSFPLCSWDSCCLVVSRVCQDSGHLEQMEFLARAGPMRPLPHSGMPRKAEFLGPEGPRIADPPSARPFVFVVGQDPNICSHTVSVSICFIPTSPVWLSKYLNLPKPLFAHLQNGDIRTFLQDWSLNRLLTSLQPS